MALTNPSMIRSFLDFPWITISRHGPERRQHGIVILRHIRIGTRLIDIESDCDAVVGKANCENREVYCSAVTLSVPVSLRAGSPLICCSTGALTSAS